MTALPGVGWDEFNEKSGKAPHCDDLILHAPQTCKYCDMYVLSQAERIREKTNFTGEHDPNKRQCPAEARRNLVRMNAWAGNQPRPGAIGGAVAAYRAGDEEHEEVLFWQGAEWEKLRDKVIEDLREVERLTRD